MAEESKSRSGDAIATDLENQANWIDGSYGPAPEVPTELLREAAAALRAVSEQQPTFEPELRALLAGLECQNVDELMSASKNRVMLCRFLGERIACAAKAGAHLQPIFGATPNERN